MWGNGIMIQDIEEAIPDAWHHPMDSPALAQSLYVDGYSYCTSLYVDGYYYCTKMMLKGLFAFL